MSYHVNPVAPVLPRLGARSVGAFGAAPPTIQGLTLDQRVAGISKGYGADAGGLFRACMTDKLGSRELIPCTNAAQKEVASLRGDQLAFYRSCMAQRSPDVPVLLQHRACFDEAKKLSGSVAPAVSAPYPPPSATPTTMPEFTAPAPSGGVPMWAWIGGAAVAAGLAFVLLKPKKA